MLGWFLNFWGENVGLCFGGRGVKLFFLFGEIVFGEVGGWFWSFICSNMIFRNVFWNEIEIRV